MKTNCENLSELVDAHDCENRFLAVIDDDGRIHQANERMKKGFHLKKIGTNFFELVHPIHTAKFRSTINNVSETSEDEVVELYLKNGKIHPMKWNVRAVTSPSNTQLYFCQGVEIVDDKRLNQLNKLANMNYDMGIEGPVSVMFHDSTGQLIAMNHQTVDLFGLSMEDLYRFDNIRGSWDNEWQIKNEFDQPLLFDDAPFRKTFRTLQPEKQVIKCRLDSGEVKWLLFQSQVLPTNDVSEETFAVSNIADITNERSLIQNLSENESLYKSFFRQMPGISWIVNQDERLVYASESFLDRYSLDKSNSLNEKLVELVPPSVSNALYEYHIRVFKTGESQELMQKLKIADGSQILYHIRLFTVTSVSGERLVGGLAIPIADNNKMEIELREANERLVLLRRATSDAIWEWDMQTGAMLRNDALIEMVGYNSESTGGLAWWLRRIHPEDRNRVGDAVKDATERHQHSWQESYRFKCADGDYKFVQDKGFVIYENGLPVKMIGSLTDISNLKQLENALENEKLEKQREISETVIRVQETERTRIGHELHDNVNQILSTAKLFMDMMKADSSDQRTIKKKSIEYVVNAIEEIRKLSKELAVPHLKLEGLANSIRSVISDMSMAGSTKFTFENDEECESLSSGKKVTIFRIVQEQLKNIVKHSRARTAHIELRVHKNEVCLKIKDEGVGFDPSKSAAGIGLSNIYERAKFYEGKVEVKAAPGRGCEMVVILPIE